MSDCESVPVLFKPKKKKNLRTRIKSEDEEEDDNGNCEEILWVFHGKMQSNASNELISFTNNLNFWFIDSAKLVETKLVQKLRVKPNGVNVIGLAIGAKVKPEDLLTKVGLTTISNQLNCD